MKNNHLNPISLGEVARLLAVSSRTVRRLVDRGDLPAFRIGTILALTPSALPEPLRRSMAAGDSTPLLTLHDAAVRLGCSPDKVRLLTANGTINAIVIGRSRRWSPLEIDAVRGREVQS